MQFLTVSRRKTESFTEAEFAARADGEFRRIGELYMQGLVRQIWRRSDMPGAIILFEAESEERVREALASLPFSQAGMLEIVLVIPLQAYPGFLPK